MLNRKEKVKMIPIIPYSKLTRVKVKVRVLQRNRINRIDANIDIDIYIDIYIHIHMVSFIIAPCICIKRITLRNWLP